MEDGSNGCNRETSFNTTEECAQELLGALRQDCNPKKSETWVNGGTTEYGDTPESKEIYCAPSRLMICKKEGENYFWEIQPNPGDYQSCGTRETVTLKNPTYNSANCTPTPTPDGGEQ